MGVWGCVGVLSDGAVNQHMSFSHMEIMQIIYLTWAVSCVCGVCL